MQKDIFQFQEASLRHLDRVGLKGAQLAELGKLGCRIAPGFIVSTDICNFFLKSGSYPAGFRRSLEESLRELEKQTSSRLGDPEKPLLLVIRPSGPTRIPEVFKSAVCVGMDRNIYLGLLDRTGNRAFANATYERFLVKFAYIVEGIETSTFGKIKKEFYDERRLPANHVLDPETFLGLVSRYLKIFGPPEGFFDQILAIFEAQYQNWLSKPAQAYRTTHDLNSRKGMALIVQQNVFGDLSGNSGTGLAFSRNPSSGKRTVSGDFFPTSTGFYVRKGSKNFQDLKILKETLRDQYETIKRNVIDAEKRFKDMIGFEFVIQESELFVLGVFHSKKTGLASVRIAVEMFKENLVNEIEALDQLHPDDINSFLLPMINPDDVGKPVLKGIPAGPGAATGRVVFNREQAVSLMEGGGRVVLAKRETTPEDISVIAEARCVGLLTLQGGLTSHGAMVARSAGKTAVTGCTGIHVDEAGNCLINAEGISVNLHDVITVNGSDGNVYLGEVETLESSEDENFNAVMEWASRFCAIDVRANCDTPEQARNAMRLGADGVGLCRMEHMLFEKGRIDAMRSMILANDRDERENYLEILYEFLKNDLTEIFRTVEGKPFCIRYLDPPLHEFLPQTEEGLAAYSLRAGKSFSEVKNQVDELKDSNPALGFRGCRLPIVYPEITIAQTRAVMEAAVELGKQGVEVNPELMFPLISTAREIEYMCEIIEECVQDVFAKNHFKINYKMGAMIETPRACMRADQIARHLDFISFGTNDLTQLAYGFSRDDIGKFLEKYIDYGMLNNDPFKVLDLVGIGKLISFAVGRAREGNPDIVIAACGEQNSDPQTIAFFNDLNVDYVSCIPYNIPSTRIAAAQSGLKRFRTFGRN